MFGNRHAEGRPAQAAQQPWGPVEPVDYAPMDPQEAHQERILADFQSAVRTSDQAESCLRDAERVAAQAGLALVEARKRMRRVTDGVV